LVRVRRESSPGVTGLGLLVRPQERGLRKGASGDLRPWVVF